MCIYKTELIRRDGKDFRMLRWVCKMGQVVKEILTRMFLKLAALCVLRIKISKNTKPFVLH